MSGPSAEMRQSSRVVQEKTEVWCNNLGKLMKQRGLTQSALAKKMNARFYDGQDSTPFSQKNVSNWVNVGRPDRKGHVRPFPKYEIMLQIADVLEVDLSYITGDIECETYDAQDASAYTGLSEEALKRIRAITHYERGYRMSNDRETEGAIASEILKSSCFPYLLEELRGLACLRDKRGEIMGEVEVRYGKELAAKAFEYQDDFICVGPGASKAEREEVNKINESVFEAAGVEQDERETFIEAVKAASQAIDRCFDETEQLRQMENAARYRVQRQFEAIVDSIFPPKYGLWGIA